MIDFLYIVIYTFIEGCDYFSVDEVIVQRLGASLILTPKEKIVDTFLSSLDEFTDDFMADGRYTGKTDKRENL